MGISELELLEIAVPIAAGAAATARRMRAEGVTGLDTKSTATDVVTAADRQVEREIVQALRELRPHDAVLGEESGGSGAAAEGGGVRWVIDPIDGTVNYLYGIEQYAVSIAAEVDGEVLAGVVHNAATGKVWTAAKGHGAWRGTPGQGRRLSGSTRTELGQALVATGFAYSAERRAQQGLVVAGVLPKVRDIRRIGSAAIDLCAAGEGVVDAFYEKGLNPWDLAAGGLIAREAGLLVTGLNGAPAGPDMALAAPPALHPALHDLLAGLEIS